MSRADDLLIKADGEVLAGSLTCPEGAGPHPLVICIHGSGPLDRDVNTRRQKLNIFNVLADDLAARGFACFRYDKRGNGASTGIYLSAGHSDLVADATAITRHFQGRSEFSHIFLLGHSEGTVIVPQVAQLCPVDGLLLLCPFVTPLEEILELQAVEMQSFYQTAPGIGGWIGRILLRLSGGALKSGQRLVARVRASEKRVLWHMFQRMPARWIREMLALDPPALFAEICCPTLVFVAGNDLQCPPQDGEAIAGMIGAQARLVVVPSLSHILRIEGEAKGFAGYAEQIKRPMAPEVLQSVGVWLEEQIRAR